MSRTNDFSDKRTYHVEKAIIRSISQIRDKDGTCPKDARHFLLDILRFNDNTNNEYSDNFKIANLLSALTNTLIPGEPEPDIINYKTSGEQSSPTHQLDMQLEINDNSMTIVDTEPEEFKNAVIQELDRYRRMDEWINSYQNLFTVTVLDCKQRLMKAKVIPNNPIEFAQYIHDGTSDFIRIKASEALVDLGFMSNNQILKLLLNILSTDPSPYVRSNIFEVVCLGFATIAFGDTKPANSGSRNTAHYPNREADMSVSGDVIADVGIDGLIVEDDVSLEARKVAISRISSWKGALAALKSELKNNDILKVELWKAIASSTIGLSEQLDLLDLCCLLYDPITSMIVRLKVPKFWEAENLGKGIIRFKQTKKMRTKPLRSLLSTTPYRSNISTGPLRLSISTGSGSRSSLGNNSITLTSKPLPKSVPKSVPKPSIVTVKTSTKTDHHTNPMTVKLPALSMRTSNKSATTISLKPFGSTKNHSKRAQETVDHLDDRPRKIVKLKSINMQKVAMIQSRPPNPIGARDRNPTTRVATPISKKSSKSGSNSGQKTQKTTSLTQNHPNLSSSSSKSGTKIRRPLPDARKPLPNSSTGQRQNLPGTSRTPVQAEVATEAPPVKKGFILKLKTGGYKGTSRPNPQ